jgi:predicted phosphodiesterase
MHFGSIYTDPNMTLEAIKVFDKEKVDIVVCAGDIVEGMMGRPGDVYELSHIGYKAQRDESIRVLSNIKQPFYSISGNHDASYNSKHGVGANIVEDICSNLSNATYLGHDEGDISVKGIMIRLFHGGDGAGYAISYRGQKIIEALSGGEKPNLLITGHSHKSIYMFNRNVHYIEAGTLQMQSSWMRGKKLAAHVGFSIANLTIKDKEIKSLQYTWYPFYK